MAHQFPMGQGREQYEHEPPRTIAPKGAYWKDRVKALGNAVVPQVLYPIALEIKNLLDAQDPSKH